MSVPVLSLSATTDGDTYFSSRLYSAPWTNATTDSKQAALNDATRIINRFDYYGQRTDPTQANSWPRKYVKLDCMILDSSVIPDDIFNAQYEIALALLSGVNIDRELRALGITSRGYSSVRVTYDPNRTAIWLELGIPSYTAWAYLLPYLDREIDGSIKLHRVE